MTPENKEKIAFVFSDILEKIAFMFAEIVDNNDLPEPASAVVIAKMDFTRRVFRIGVSRSAGRNVSGTGCQCIRPG